MIDAEVPQTHSKSRTQWAFSAHRRPEHQPGLAGREDFFGEKCVHQFFRVSNSEQRRPSLVRQPAATCVSQRR